MADCSLSASLFFSMAQFLSLSVFSSHFLPPTLSAASSLLFEIFCIFHLETVPVQLDSSDLVLSLQL